MNETVLINLLLFVNSIVISVLAYFLKDLKRSFEKRLDSIDEKIENVKEKYVTKEICFQHRNYLIERIRAKQTIL